MLRTLTILFVCCLAFCMAGHSLAAGTDDARQFVDGVGKHVLEVINGNGGEAEKKKQLQQLFSDDVDMAWMGQFVLGHGWSQATEDQRNRYMQAYRQYLLAKYTTNFTDYTGSKYTITDVKTGENGQYTVDMKIKTPNQGQEDTLAGYRVRSENGQFKIVDIIIEGVSLITTQRSEFAAVLQQKGIDGLISAIEEKTGAESRAAH